MAEAQIKTTQLAKDFNIKAKDVSEVFAEMNIDKKTGATVSSDEFAMFLNRITVKNQIKDLDSYLTGKNRISIVRSAAEMKMQGVFCFANQLCFKSSSERFSLVAGVRSSSSFGV